MSLATGPVHSIWRRSASIILLRAGETVQNITALMAKRSKNSTFMPNYLVFPGGLTDQEDFCDRWHQAFPILSNFSVDSKAVFPDLFQPEPNQSFESVHVGYRICAIRELFEETGLFLATTPNRNQCMVLADLPERRAVHHNPQEFLAMCQRMNLVPDIWRLRNWATWLTPTHLQHTRRYDTQFYSAIIEEDVLGSSDDTEVTDVEFWDIHSLLKEAQDNDLMVAPPQLYEVHRLASLADMNEVEEYTAQRESLGTERYFPIRIGCKDGAIIVSPGDSLYPEVPDIHHNYPPLSVKLTVNECMTLFPSHNRMIMKKGEPVRIADNINHVLGFTSISKCLLS